jgi:hypothetical protein
LLSRDGQAIARLIQVASEFSVRQEGRAMSASGHNSDLPFAVGDGRFRF